MMVRMGQEIRYWKYYLLGTNHDLFRNVLIRDPRHNSDHFMILGCLCSATPSEHKKKLGRRLCFTLQPPTRDPMREDTPFMKIR